MNERGAELVGTLAIGFAVLLLVAQALVTVGRITTAGASAEETARYAATWAARHGTASDAENIARDLLPNAQVKAADTPNGIAVAVTIQVSLIGPAGFPVTTSVTGTAAVPVSRYRSTP